MNKLKTYMLYGVLSCLLLLAVGCTEPSSEDSSAAGTASKVTESSAAQSVSAEDSSAHEDSSVSEDNSHIEISIPEDSNESEDESEPTESVPEDESSFTPDFSGIYRDDEEPKLEDIVIPPLVEKEFAFLKTKLTIALGQNGRIPYEFYPIATTDQALVWSSDNESVVSVDENGLLTGTGLGTAKITAVTPKGNTASCTVTVVKEIILSPLAQLVQNYSNGDPTGKSFALADVNFDGKTELIARVYGENGFPVITILDTETGKTLATFVTGADEEWGIWKSKDGSTYLLLSYTQNYPDGTIRYGLDEIIPEDGAKFVPLMARENKNGKYTYYTAPNGALATCTYDAYQALRQVYFADNRQTAVLELLWMGGTNVEEIATALKNPPKK